MHNIPVRGANVASVPTHIQLNYEAEEENFGCSTNTVVKACAPSVNVQKHGNLRVVPSKSNNRLGGAIKNRIFLHRFML